jgi:hypothetical protein
MEISRNGSGKTKRQEPSCGCLIDALDGDEPWNRVRQLSNRIRTSRIGYDVDRTWKNNTT